MNTELDQARSIADRVARRVAGEPSSGRGPDQELTGELAAVRASLSELQRRLAQIEARVRSGADEAGNLISKSVSEKAIPMTHSPWLVGVNESFAHPSQEKFGVEEAVVSELVDFFEKEKTCGIEPGGKPCDHCSMCSTRGF